MGGRGRWVALVGGVALLVRLPLLTAQGSVTGGDGPVYFTIAHSLLDGDWLAGNDYRTPGYPIAITPALVVDRVLGHGEAELVLGAQDLLGILLAVAIVLVGARYFGLWVGVAAGLLAALSPVLLVLERFTYPDLMYACALFAGAALLAEGALRGGDRRWLAASGIVFGLAAYLKPAAQALLVAPFLVLLVSRRGLRAASIGGAVAAAAMVLTMSPWLIHNAANGTAGMSEQGGLTLFYRAFDDDRYAVPTDVRYGPSLRRLQLQHESKPHDRFWERALKSLQARKLSQSEAFDVMGDAASTAIRRHAGTYALRSADDVRRTVTDLAATSPGTWEGLKYYDYLHDQFDAARIGIPPPALAWGAVQLGIGLGLVWLVVTVGGLAALALPFAPDPRTRAAGSAFLVTWLVAAVTTALGHGSLWRYSAGLAPIAWVVGLAGARLVWTKAYTHTLGDHHASAQHWRAARAPR